MSRVIPALAVLVAATLGLSACAGIVPMTPAPESNNPLCAEVGVRLGTVADLTKRETNAQATAAWGEPASVLLTCGLEAPGPTTLPCVNVNGVDWIMDDGDRPIVTFTSFGRMPAVQVVVNSAKVNGSTVLADLASPVSQIPRSDQCLGLEDVTSAIG